MSANKRHRRNLNNPHRTRIANLVAGLKADLLAALSDVTDILTDQPGDWHRMAALHMRKGVYIWDDFITAWDAVQQDWLPWQTYAIGGGGTADHPNGALWTTAGVRRVTANAGAGNGIVHHLGHDGVDALTMYGPPPTNTEYVVKARLGAAYTNCEAWFGTMNARQSWPDIALTQAPRMIGVCVQAAGAAANWNGVCSDGAGAGNQTFLDLGVAADNTWREFRMVRTSTGVAFYVNDALIGSITTNIPLAGNPQFPDFGIVTQDAAAKALELDYYGIFAPVGNRY